MSSSKSRSQDRFAAALSRSHLRMGAPRAVGLEEVLVRRLLLLRQPPPGAALARRALGLDEVHVPEPLAHLLAPVADAHDELVDVGLAERRHLPLLLARLAARRRQRRRLALLLRRHDLADVAADARQIALDGEGLLVALA